MNDDMYAELLESVREGGKILRGEAEASRTRSVNVDAQAARAALQEEAAELRLTPATLARVGLVDRQTFRDEG